MATVEPSPREPNHASRIEAEIAAEIIDLVPHWYQADCGPERYSLKVHEHRAVFYNHRKLTPALDKFLSIVQRRLKELQFEYFRIFPSLIDVLLENLAIEWLEIHSPQTDWKRLIKYLEELSRRTHENQPVGLNLIIKSGTGRGDITQPRLQKILDQLASSPFSFLAVAPDLELIDYGEVSWSQVNGNLSYKFYPEFLHPIHCVLEEGQVSAHLTTQGDLIFMNREGLLAARRKRKWRIYDVRTFKNSLALCLGKYTVGANLFEIVFDLSFRRSGALLVYDPEHHTRHHILNKESILFPGWKESLKAEGEQVSGQALIGPSLENLAMAEGVGALRRKHRLIELSRVDGAVVFDDKHLLAVGAIIQAHPGVGSQLGARTTAARSAYLWGAHPVKVSSDGDVTVYFASRQGNNECDAEMHFL
jgi:hypothetical protein